MVCDSAKVQLNCGLLPRSMPQQRIPELGSLEWQNITSRGVGGVAVTDLLEYSRLRALELFSLEMRRLSRFSQYCSSTTRGLQRLFQFHTSLEDEEVPRRFSCVHYSMGYLVVTCLCSPALGSLRRQQSTHASLPHLSTIIHVEEGDKKKTFIDQREGRVLSQPCDPPCDPMT